MYISICAARKRDETDGDADVYTDIGGAGGPASCSNRNP